MPLVGMLEAAASRVRVAVAKLQLAAGARDREEARLAEARRLDADEVGRRADERKAKREDAARG